MSAPQHITYLTEPVPDYHKELDACTDLMDLRAFLYNWRLLANDAKLIGEAMSPDDWRPYQKGLRSERRGKYAGDPWTVRYAAILLPEILFRVSVIAQQFCCPWGLAYCRCKEAGKLVEDNGIAIWKEKP